jgi:hypothetical protein
MSSENIISSAGDNFYISLALETADMFRLCQTLAGRTFARQCELMLDIAVKNDQ